MEDRLGQLRPGDGAGSKPISGKRRLAGWFVLILTALATLAAVSFLFPSIGSLSKVGQLVDFVTNKETIEVGDIPELGIAGIQLNAPLPPRARQLLQRLRQEPCDRDAIVPLATSLKDGGYPRQSAQALESFYIRCKGPSALLDDAVETLMALSDFQKAHQLATALVNDDPAYARYRYLRGWAAEKLGLLNESLLDHVAALNLLGDPQHVAGSVFYDVALAHSRLGQHCEAITPIQQWASYEAARDTPQTRTIIREFSEKGNCGALYASSTKDFSLQINGDVIEAIVEVNGEKGRFIIDTGASLVAMKEQFARRADIKWDPENKILMSTANGTIANVLSTAKRVALGPAIAQNVSIAISPDEALPGEVDGLLGMSFLARFKVSMSQTEFVIGATK